MPQLITDDMAIITLDYIESNFMQYIDTGYVAKSENYRIKMKFVLNQIYSGSVLFGGGASTDIISIIAQNPAKIYVGSGRVTAFSSINFTQGAIHDIDCHANNGSISVTFDGTTYTSTYSGSINKDYSMYLFANNQSGTPGMSTSGYIYGCQIYDNNELVRDYVPAMDSEGNIGLYDRITKRIYTSATDYDFSRGNPIGIVMDGTSELTPIEYIESTGEQAIKTTSGANTNTKVVCDFEFTGENTDNGASLLFGCLSEYTQTGYYFGATHEESKFIGCTGSIEYPSLNSYNTNRHKISLSVTEILFDGVNVGGNSNTQYHMSYLICIFGIYYKVLQGFAFLSKAKMYSCKIYDGDTLIADYKPYTYSGVAGLYKSVDKTFYPSYTEIPFVAGPEVSKALDFESFPFGFRRRLLLNVDQESGGLPVGTTIDFPYTGTSQGITLPKGTYRLETWGASGGDSNSTYQGGKGGYSVGEATFEQDTTLYVIVGGRGSNSVDKNGAKGGYNGGGNGGYGAAPNYGVSLAGAGGGGATHISTGIGFLSELSNSKDSIIIVAGGGGGASGLSEGGGSSPNASYGASGGAGGGENGLNGEGRYGEYTSVSDLSADGAIGGTQTYGGSGGDVNYTEISGADSAYSGSGGGGGGAGYYGGGGGGGGSCGGDGTYVEGQYGYNGSFGKGGKGGDSADMSWGYYAGIGSGGGGGSGYISTILNNASTINGSYSIQSPNGGTEYGHEGDGYARITVLK